MTTRHIQRVFLAYPKMEDCLTHDRTESWERIVIGVKATPQMRTDEIRSAWFYFAIWALDMCCIFDYIDQIQRRLVRIDWNLAGAIYTLPFAQHFGVAMTVLIFGRVYVSQWAQFPDSWTIHRASTSLHSFLHTSLLSLQQALQHRERLCLIEKNMSWPRLLRLWVPTRSKACQQPWLMCPWVRNYLRRSVTLLYIVGAISRRYFAMHSAMCISEKDWHPLLALDLRIVDGWRLLRHYLVVSQCQNTARQ